jgi:hypothetical protein
MYQLLPSSILSETFDLLPSLPSFSLPLTSESTNVITPNSSSLQPDSGSLSLFPQIVFRSWNHIITKDQFNAFILPNRQTSNRQFVYFMLIF